MAIYQYLDNQDPNNDGCILGQTSSAKVAFYGGTPASRPAAVTAVVTTASTSTSSAFGYTTSAQAEAIVTAVNTVITRLQTLGLTA